MREPLDLTVGHLLGIADHSPLRSTEWKVMERALPGHDGSKSPYGIDYLIRMEPYPTLGWSQSIVIVAIINESPKRIIRYFRLFFL